MSEIGRDLRKRIAESLSPGALSMENPLRTIGLSEQILHMGLADDELYEFCRYQARYLVRQFHSDDPDKRTPEATEKQHRFMEAFNRIKSDRAAFDKALQEFRDHRSTERSSVNFLRRSYGDLIQRLRGYQSRELDISKAEKEIERKQAEAGKLLREAESIRDRQAGQVNTLQGEVRRITGRLAVEERHRARFQYLLRYVHYLSMEDPKKLHIFNLKWVAVAALVGKGVKAPGLFSGKEPHSVFKKLRVKPETIQDIRDRFDILQAGFTGSKNPNVLRTGLLEISRCRVRAIHGLPSISTHWTVLGSLVTGLNAPPGLTKRARERDFVYQYLDPYVLPGGYLVLEKFHGWSKESSIENANNPKPLFDLNSERVILAAG